jgi:hypothetical protein
MAGLGIGPKTREAAENARSCSDRRFDGCWVGKMGPDEAEKKGSSHKEKEIAWHINGE